MSPRLFLLAPLFASTVAYAQAPGEAVPAPYYQPPQPPPGEYAVMAHRFAVGVNIGGYSVAPSNADSDKTSTDFSTAELSVRYRITPRFELELLLSGGREILEDGSDGDLAMGGATLAARYRFRPQQPWNWWLVGGIGGTVIESHTATKQQRDDATRGHLAVGVGLERRFNHFALNAEFRMMGLGPRSDSDTMEVIADDVRRAESLSAGQLTLGASLYF